MIGLLEIFYSPGNVFDRVRERGTWFPPLLAMIVIGVLSGAILMNMVSMNAVIRKQLESDPRTVERLGQDGIERISGNPRYKALWFVGAITIPIVVVIVAGIFMGALSLSGARVRFPQVLGATGYAWWPYSVFLTVMTLLIVTLSADRSELNFKNLVATNAGAFLDPQTTSKPLYSIASSIDILSFGLIALLSYGLSRVSGAKLGTCAVIVICVWAVYVLGKTGAASIF